LIDLYFPRIPVGRAEAGETLIVINAPDVPGIAISLEQRCVEAVAKLQDVIGIMRIEVVHDRHISVILEHGVARPMELPVLQAEAIPVIYHRDLQHLTNSPGPGQKLVNACPLGFQRIARPPPQQCPARIARRNSSAREISYARETSYARDSQILERDVIVNNVGGAA
jgi:hypothetical protein